MTQNIILKVMFLFLLPIGILDSSFAKSHKDKLKDKCDKYEKNNSHTKCIVSKKSCDDKILGNGWKMHGKKAGDFRMCVRSDCDRKCRNNLKDKCKTFEKDNNGYQCKIEKTKKGCSKPWKNYGKPVGDYQMCTMKKCDKNCKDKKGKDAAKKICKEIQNSSGRPCKVIEAKIYKRDKKACGKGWAKQDKVRYVEGYNANNYIICVKKTFDAANANSLSGSSSSYDSSITAAINAGIAANINLNNIANDINKGICDVIKDNSNPDPRLTLKKCKNNQSPGFTLGNAFPSVTVKNSTLVGKSLKFDYLIQWQTQGLNLKYTVKTSCKYKKNKGTKKDWKCTDIKLRLKDFGLSMIGKGVATANPSGNYSYVLKSDEKSFKHSARFSACLKFFNTKVFKFCPGIAERVVSDTLKAELLKALNGI